MNAFAWFASSYAAGLVGRRCARRGRVPTASSAADGVALLIKFEDDLRCDAGTATALMVSVS